MSWPKILALLLVFVACLAAAVVLAMPDHVWGAVALTFLVGAFATMLLPLDR